MISKLFTYFGCKTKVIDLAWQHMAGPGWSKYFEPFAGTAVVALNAPDTVNEIYLNDFDCHVANVLRSVIYFPEEVIESACHPRLELDLHMIHDYLQSYSPTLREQLMTGIQACDPIKAGGGYGVAITG